jgi:hypothetical protein
MSASTIDAAALGVGERAVLTDSGDAWLVEVVAQRSNPSQIDVRLRMLVDLRHADSDKIGKEIDLWCIRPAQWIAGWWLRDPAKFAASHAWAASTLAPYLAP